MQNNMSRNWSDLRNLVVYIPKLGKSVGSVVDFFFKEGTNAVYALRVHTHVNGDYALPVRGIKAIELDKVIIENENMLIKALPPLPQSQDLIGQPVFSEKDEELGTISEVVLALNPPAAMRLSGITLASNGHKAYTISADSISGFVDGKAVIENHIARKLS
ncbi:PRC-barrel domain-containing protein [Ktedonospora formicarum]|uniref:PRC-barrel domain-containing protein n=1 Tax=Ktedonospora formicarum TaxID=2778364 RepID=A0A8J3HUB8_9CHLR|nr:PRC-barrel domain-containing protein [Ktedonospora formicarum]GHO44147.1 hypothetical protein KSX_23100 [Ktedonospora formicarum]